MRRAVPEAAATRVGAVVDAVREVTDSPALRQLARVGLVAYGLVHLLIVVLATRLAWGARGADADQTGALRTIGDWTGGPVVLWGIGLGLLALAVWQGGEVLLWRHGLLAPSASTPWPAPATPTAIPRPDPRATRSPGRTRSQATRSKTAASPCPPPMHIVSSP